MFAKPVLRMDQAAWSAATVEAFEFFGGVPAGLVPDNLGTGVERPDLYDPKTNQSYAELANHYAVLWSIPRGATSRGVEKATKEGAEESLERAR